MKEDERNTFLTQIRRLSAKMDERDSAIVMFFEFIPVLAAIVEDGEFVRVNSAWTKHLGLSSRQLVDSKVESVIAPADRDHYERNKEGVVDAEPIRLVNSRGLMQDFLYWSTHSPNGGPSFLMAAPVEGKRVQCLWHECPLAGHEEGK